MSWKLGRLSRRLKDGVTTLADLRRFVEFYLSVGPDLPDDLDPPAEPRFHWDD